MTKITHFTVEGRGEFPLDMLRYDQCWPRGPEDAAKMEASYASELLDVVKDHGLGRRTIDLATIIRPGYPTVDRWASFGWVVTTVADQYRHQKGG